MHGEMSDTSKVLWYLLTQGFGALETTLQPLIGEANNGIVVDDVWRTVFGCYGAVVLGGGRHPDDQFLPCNAVILLSITLSTSVSWHNNPDRW